MGVNVDKVIFIIFMLGGLLAGLAGMLFGMKYTVYPQIGNITTKSFIAAVFGGLGSLPGAIIGSVLLGLIETMTSGYLSSQYREDVYKRQVFINTAIWSMKAPVPPAQDPFILCSKLPDRYVIFASSPPNSITTSVEGMNSSMAFVEAATS